MNCVIILMGTRRQDSSGCICTENEIVMYIRNFFDINISWLVRTSSIIEDME